MFTIRFLFLLIFLASVLAAVFTSGSYFLPRTLFLLLVINGIGAAIAIVVTFVFRFPRDGSLRGNYDDEDEQEFPEKPQPPVKP